MAREFLKVRSGVGLQPNTAPSDPANGDIYYDSGTNSFKFYQNGAFVTIPSSVVTTIGTFDGAAPAANGLTITGTNLFAQSATASVPGMVNIASQTFAGAKTFNTSISTPSFLLTGTSSGAITFSVPATTSSYSVVWPSAVAVANEYLLSSDTSGNLSWVPGPSRIPRWTLITLSFASFSAAANTNDVSLTVLPARTMLHQVVIKHSAPAAGAGLTAYTLSVGLATNFTAYTQPFDVKQAVAQAARSITQIDDVPNFGSTQDIRIQAISTGALLNGVTTGTFSIWILTSVLP